jgi:hypothetical protein
MPCADSGCQGPEDKKELEEDEEEEMISNSSNTKYMGME